MMFDVDNLAEVIQRDCQNIVFAFLFGSAQGGQIKDVSDVDIAVYLRDKADLEFYEVLLKVVECVVPADRCDVTVLNTADVITRFEALKGRRLFVRDMQQYASFFH